SSSPIASGALGLLSKETNAVQHLTSTCPSGVEPPVQPLVLLLQMCDPREKVDARRSAAVRLHVLQSRFGKLRPATKARQLVGEVADQCIQLLKRNVLSRFVV